MSALRKRKKRGRAPRSGGGDCLQVAAHLLLQGDAPPSARLCHGIVCGTGGEAKGLWFVHAWVEYEEPIASEVELTFVLDRANGHNVRVSAALYYQIGQPRCVRRYDRKESIDQVLQHGHCGPWDEQLLTWEPQAAPPTE